MSTMFESNDWSPKLRKAAKNFTIFLNIFSDEKLIALIDMALAEGFKNGLKASKESPDKEEES